MNTKLLKLLYENSRYTVGDLATMLGISEAEVKADMEKMEKSGLICGYKAVIDWSRVDNEKVSAMIELKVTPKTDAGFEYYAEQITKYPEVESVYLMSGAYDICVIVKGKSFLEVADFVAKVLAPMNGVNSTATHFVLKRYKEMDIELGAKHKDDRGKIGL